MLLYFVLGWMVVGIISYLISAKIDHSFDRIYTVGDLFIAIFLGALMGPVALFICLMLCLIAVVDSAWVNKFFNKHINWFD